MTDTPPEVESQSSDDLSDETYAWLAMMFDKHTEQTAPPPPPPPGGMPPPPPVTHAPLARGGGGIDPKALKVKLKKSATSYATLEEEREKLNEFLASAGVDYDVKSDDELQLAKKAAGIGSTARPAADFDGFAERLKEALQLGALGGSCRDAGVQRAYAERFQAAAAEAVPQRKKSIEAAGFTFEQCIRIAAAVTEEAIYGLSPESLASKVKKKIGHGNLAGIFPGENEEATPEEGGQNRLDRMVDLGKEIVEYLRQFGDVKPEVTGSIILKKGGYGGTPEDLDINITTQGTPEERAEMWKDLVDWMNGYDGSTIYVKGGTVRVFPMTDGKVSGENSAIWECRYGYVLNLGGEESKIMPFDVEVKDVGGDVWKAHLAETADERSSDESGTSKPAWLLVDTLTRILGHRDNMKKSLQSPDPDHLEGVPEEEQPAKWLELVRREGLELSQSKRLWEKLKVAAEMAAQDPAVERVGLGAWVQKQVKNPRAYLELLEKAGDQKAYSKWLLTLK